MRSVKCSTNGCKNTVHVHSYWMMCIDCYSSIPDHIPHDQVNLYKELQAEKENYETSNNM